MNESEKTKTEAGGGAAVSSTPLLDALEAVLLFYTVGPWDEAKKTRWWNLTQTNEATTKNLCDNIRKVIASNTPRERRREDEHGNT